MFMIDRKKTQINPIVFYIIHITIQQSNRVITITANYRDFKTCYPSTVAKELPKRCAFFKIVVLE